MNFYTAVLIEFTPLDYLLNKLQLTRQIMISRAKVLAMTVKGTFQTLQYLYPTKIFKIRAFLVISITTFWKY